MVGKARGFFSGAGPSLLPGLKRIKAAATWEMFFPTAPYVRDDIRDGRVCVHLYGAVLCCAVQSGVVPCRAVWYGAVRAVPCRVLRCSVPCLCAMCRMLRATQAYRAYLCACVGACGAERYGAVECRLEQSRGVSAGGWEAEKAAAKEGYSEKLPHEY